MMSEYIAERIFDEFERDSNGRASGTDCMLMFTMISSETYENQMSMIFTLLDRDKQESISVEEFKQFFDKCVRMGWCYDKVLLYEVAKRFPPAWARRDIDEAVNELLKGKINSSGRIDRDQFIDIKFDLA